MKNSDEKVNEGAFCACDIDAHKRCLVGRDYSQTWRITEMNHPALYSKGWLRWHDLHPAPDTRRWEPRVLPSVLFMIFSISCKQVASDYEQNTPEYTYQRNETVFFLENSTEFVFWKLPEETKSYISTAQLTKIHSTVEMFTPRHLDTNDQILNTAHDA